MKLGEGPAMLVLSGQGVGNGVEHFLSPVTSSENGPTIDLVEKWCSLSDPLIPTSSQDLVVMIARQATPDGVPWIIVSHYVQARLKGSTRGKQYAGVGVLVRAMF
jgi:hypothetical protein